MSTPAKTASRTPSGGEKRHKGKHGLGTIRERSPGRFEGRIWLPNGRRFTCTDSSKRAVQRRLIGALDKAERGQMPPDPRMTVETWLRRWLEESVKPNREPRTYDGYAQDIRLYLVPALGKKKLGDRKSVV